MARIYTKDILLNPGDIANMSNILNQRENAAAENRRQFANLWSGLANAGASIGQAMVQQKEIEDRYKSVEDKDVAYKNDPIWIAAKEEYARTGNANVLNQTRSLFTAEAFAAAAKSAAEANAAKIAADEKKAAKENYEIAERNWRTAQQKLELLQNDSTTKRSDILDIQKEIDDQAQAMRKYGPMFDDTWTMPSYGSAPSAADETAVEAVEPLAPVSSITDVNRLQTDFVTKFSDASGKVKPYTFTAGDLADWKDAVNAMSEGDEKNKQLKEIAKYEAQTIDKKPKQKKVTYQLDKGSGMYKKFVDGKFVGMVERKGE